MVNSLNDAVIDTVLNATPSMTCTAGGKQIPYLFLSPLDWRDHWISFLLVDRFDNPRASPRSADPCDTYQGGSFDGIKRRLPYLKDFGVGAIWLSPLLLNPPWFDRFWGGYGILDFLRGF